MYVYNIKYTSYDQRMNPEYSGSMDVKSSSGLSAISSAQRHIKKHYKGVYVRITNMGEIRKIDQRRGLLPKTGDNN